MATKRRRSDAQREYEASIMHGELDLLQQSLEEGMLEGAAGRVPPPKKVCALKPTLHATQLSQSKSRSSPILKSGDAGGVSYEEQVLHPSYHSQPTPFPTDLLKPAPLFYYNDYSRADDHDNNEDLVPQGWAGNFPLKLHAILLRKDLVGVATWMPHGRSFRISNPRDFETRAVTKYFSNGKFSVFIRQMKAWGFRRITSAGPDRNSYYHEMFLRGMPHLIKRMTYHGKTTEWGSQFDPLFNDISAIFPVPEKGMNSVAGPVLAALKTGGQRESLAAPVLAFKIDGFLSNLLQETQDELSGDSTTFSVYDHVHNFVQTTGAASLAVQYPPFAESGIGSELLTTSYALDLLDETLIASTRNLVPPRNLQIETSFEAATAAHAGNLGPLVPPRTLESSTVPPTDDPGLLELLQNKTPSEMMRTVVSPLVDRLNVAEDIITNQQEQIHQLQMFLAQCIGVNNPMDEP